MAHSSLLCIDSRKSGTNNFSHFTFTPASAIINVKRVRVLNCLIPNTIDVFATNFNNVISFNDGVANLTCTITAGSYDEIALATHIGTIMTTASAGFGALVFTCSYSDVSNKFTISTTGAWSLTCSGAQFPCHELGFNATAKASTIVGLTHVCVSDFHCNLLPPQYIYINIAGLGKNIIDGRGQIIVPLFGESYSITNFNSNANYDIVISSQSGLDIHHFEVKATDYFGRENLLNQHWSMVLELIHD